jgi:D-tyrosyl-tRNA(Tyr) deacylase
MRAVIQRVSEAQVMAVSGETEVIAKIGPGLCIFLGVGRGDTERSANSLARKISGLRVFADSEGKLNRSVRELGGEVLVVSQFTLYGDCRRGNRPSFSEAAPPAIAEKLYDYFVAQLRGAGLRISTGRFQSAMQVSLVNDGPVTLMLEQ